MKSWTIACLSLLLAACGGLKSADPPVLYYRLTAPALQGGEPLAADLLVPRPAAAPGLDSQQLATRWPGLRLDYYADARWSVPVPGMVQAALAEALQGTGRLRSVQGDLARFRSTHVLDLEVRRFEADYQGGEVPVAWVAIAGTVGRQSDRRVIASWSVEASVPARANRLSDVVAAIDAAFDQAATETATRAMDAIAADLARQPTAAAER